MLGISGTGRPASKLDRIRLCGRVSTELYVLSAGVC
jgi:hypothetical protein